MTQTIRITGLESFTVAIPFRAPLVSAFGISYPARVRTFIQLHTDAGLTGLGETGPSAVHPFNRDALLTRFEKGIRPVVLGENPFDHTWIRQKLYHSADAVAVEMACWDIMAQAARVPLYRLLGGQGQRTHVPIAGYCFFRAPAPDGTGMVKLDNYVEHCQQIQGEGNFAVLKLKLGANPPEEEAQVIRLVREMLGGKIALRIDPNGCWSIPTALRMIKRLESLDLEYIEEPIRIQGPGDNTVNTAGLRRLRNASRTPIAADHCYRLDLLAQIIRDEASDVALADVFSCGGIEPTMRYAKTAAAFGLGLAMHSGTELGVGQAAKLHIAAALSEEMRYAGDAIYPEYVDDILLGGKLIIANGMMAVPQEPGLGVRLDPARLQKWELSAERHCEIDAFWEQTKKSIGVDYPSADLLMRHY